MWPWEHLAFGYLLYSGSVRLRRTGPPTDVAVILLLFATQLPDLVDKPLAWTLGVLPTGQSLGHSLLFALPFIGLVSVVARRFAAPEYAIAIAIGYLSHLAGDVVYWVFRGGGLTVGFLLWPLVPARPVGPMGFFTKFTELLATFLAFLATPLGRSYLLLESAFLGAALLVWLVDGRPGLPWHLFGANRDGSARRAESKRDS